MRRLFLWLLKLGLGPLLSSVAGCARRLRRYELSLVGWIATIAAGAAGLVFLLAAPIPVWADEPVGELENVCPGPGGQGKQCATEADCKLNTYATICVEEEPGDPFSRKCQIPCEAFAQPEGADGDQGGDLIQAVPGSCAMGETCVEGKATPGRKSFYCKLTSFRVDLNLLDQAVVHHIEGLQPASYEGDCSLEANLAALLDQNGDKMFDIFDLDLCVLAFLEQPGCQYDDETETWSCEADDLTACAKDKECGQGLYCDAVRHACQRDCGFISSREEEFDKLERECMGWLKECNHGRGRCESVDPELTICEADSQCPSGAYCLVGRCAPMCFSSAQCPGLDWYCAQNNHCRAAPHPDADEGFVFDPKNYAVRFARDSMELDAVQIWNSSPLLIMDLITKKQVLDNPSVTFGYRLLLSYGLKQDVKCLIPFVDCTIKESRPEGESEEDCFARQDDCFVDDTEHWMHLVSPFGTVSAQGDTLLSVNLVQQVADELSPGIYPATLRAVFDNGDSDTIQVRLVKTSPSGEYTGQLSVYFENPNILLNPYRPLTLAMRLKLTQETTTWDELMADNNAGEMAEVYDNVSSGYVVRGLLHGADSFSFSRGDALDSKDDEVPFVGLYSPELGSIRLVGFIDIPADFCISDSGEPCDWNNDEQVKVQNLFGRAVRRKIEFFGPFDESQKLFHGMYTEKITGLFNSALTLQGGFRLYQDQADDSPLELDALLPTGASPVAFPDPKILDTLIAAAIDEYCVDLPGQDGVADAPDTALWAENQFLTKANLDLYLKQAKRKGAPNEYSAQGRTTIFPQLWEFNDIIEYALTALDEGKEDQQSHLNIYDFVSSRVLPCDPDNPSPPPVCIDEGLVRCGLALHQKAIRNGWVKGTWVSGTGAHDLFCLDAAPTPDCHDTAAEYSALFLLQEHNHFWRDLGQILKFDGDRARSDAFMTMVRNEIDPFSEGAALAYKSAKLVHAMKRYDSLVKIVVGPVAADVLYNWNAKAFKQQGADWINLMHIITWDRLGALAELMDLQRRIFSSTGQSHYMFAHHMMQQEYLVQVYLAGLQIRWQKELAGYLGESAEIFELGQKMLNRLNPTRNPAGFQPGVVFFENSSEYYENTDHEQNWENYRKILVGSDEDDAGGLVGDAHVVVAEAIDELQGALADLDELEESLLESQFDLEDVVAEVCGNPNPGGTDLEHQNYCQYLWDKYLDNENFEDFQLAMKCKLDPAKLSETQKKLCPDNWSIECPADYKNSLDDDQNSCQQVVATFTEGTSWMDTEEPAVPGEPPPEDLIHQKPICYLDKELWTINVNGVERPCVGGEMAALLQEKAQVDRERMTLLGGVETLLLEMKGNIEAMSQSVSIAEEQAILEASAGAAIAVTEVVIKLIADGAMLEDHLSSKVPCMVIVGLAGGTDCPAKIPLAAVDASLHIGAFAATKVADALVTAWEVTLASTKNFAEINLLKLQWDATILPQAREIDDLLDSYDLLTSQSFNLAIQIEGLMYKVQFASDRYHDKVKFAADHLVGRESGYVLRGDAKVRAASDLFLEIVQYSYRLVQAFGHEFNVSTEVLTLLQSNALSMVTLNDFDDFLWLIDKLAQDYCGKEAIDCDWNDPANVEVLRYSLREQLFPQLHDIIDSKTGKLVTAGQQFHNLVTQPPYLHRRIRGVLPTDQIELPFQVPVTLMDNGSTEPEWLINPLECNHHLASGDWESVAPSSEGTVAVMLVGKNLGSGAEKGVTYELVRGGTDYMRSCHPESIVEEIGTMPVLQYPVWTWLVGYAPQSTQAQQQSIPAFFSHSQGFHACLGAEEEYPFANLQCWKVFGRDRSLAAPDWKLVIPLRAGGGALESAWIAEEDMAEEDRPVVEDIVVYLRYTSRSLDE